MAGRWGLLPGIDRRPLKKMTPDQNELAVLPERWRRERPHYHSSYTTSRDTTKPGSGRPRNKLRPSFRRQLHPEMDHVIDVTLSACRRSEAAFPATSQASTADLRPH